MLNLVFSSVFLIITLIGCAREPHKEFVYDDDEETLRKLESADRKAGNATAKIIPVGINNTQVQAAHFAHPHKIQIVRVDNTIQINAAIDSISLAAIAENSSIAPAKVTVGIIRLGELSPRIHAVGNSDEQRSTLFARIAPSIQLTSFQVLKELPINQNGSIQAAFPSAEPWSDALIVLAINHAPKPNLTISTYNEKPIVVAKRINTEDVELHPTDALFLKRYIFDTTTQSSQSGKLSSTEPKNARLEQDLESESIVIDMIGIAGERISWGWQFGDKSISFNSFIDANPKNQYLVTGDLNLDGELSTEDSGVIVRFASGLQILSNFQKLASDFNVDDVTSRLDAMFLSILSVQNKISLPVKTGDPNLNGIISQKDKRIISQTIEQNKDVLFGFEWESPYPTLLMDLNSDGLVNARDLTLLDLYLAGTIKKLPLLPYDLDGDSSISDKDRKILEDFLTSKTTLSEWQTALLVDNYPDNVISLKDFDVGVKFRWRYYYGYLPLRKGRLRTQRTAGGLPAINSGDADLIRAHIAQTTPLAGELFEMADINDDQVVDNIDLDHVESLIRGELRSWPPAN